VLQTPEALGVVGFHLLGPSPPAEACVVADLRCLDQVPEAFPFCHQPPALNHSTTISGGTCMLPFAILALSDAIETQTRHQVTPGDISSR
jgi:hypothetical protein